MKRILFLFILLILISVADAAPVLNNSAVNSVTSIWSTTNYSDSDSSISVAISGNIPVGRDKFRFDFTTYKFISDISFPMRINYQGRSAASGCTYANYNVMLIPSRPVDDYGNIIYENVTPASFYIDGIFYGIGYYGFTSDPDPEYFVIVRATDDAYALSLTGVKTVDINYDHSVFQAMSYTWSYPYVENCLNTFFFDASSNEYGMMDSSNYYTQTDSTARIKINEFTSWTNYWEYWKDAAAGTQWITVFRNNSDTTVQFKRDGNIIYHQRNTTNIDRYYFANTNSLLANFRNMGTGTWYNYTLEGAAVPDTSLGSVEFSKEIYLNEDMNISYSLTTPDFNTKSYYMKFFNPSNQQLQTFQITNASGNWTPTFNKNVLGNYSVWLGYQSLGCGFFCYDTFLDEDYANYGNQPTSISGNITANKNTYNVSETMLIYYNTTTAGQIVVKNMDGFVSARNLISYVGTNKVTTYVFQPDTGTGGDPLGNYVLTLEYKNYQGNWITLGSKSVNLISPTAIIEFLLLSYYQGDNAEFYFYAKEAGNVTVYDPAGNVKYFRDVPAGDINTRIDDNFYIKPTDPTGTWTAKLYNATDVADQATITVKQKSPGITPTITGTLPPTPVGTVDYLGNATNKKRKENEILNSMYSTITGLLMLSILATMVFFLKKMKW